MDRTELLQKWAHQPVLDHGHVKLVDLMGDDERIEEVWLRSRGVKVALESLSQLKLPFEASAG